MIVVGITGGIASGKTTMVRLLKKKNMSIHDSDAVVRKIYSRPTTKFTNYLKEINLGHSIKNNKINKPTIREEVFNSPKKRKNLEKYIHQEVKKDRDIFLQKHKQKKTNLVFLDIPLLFENRLEKICDHTILLYAPLKLRKKRAIKRKGMNKQILEKIIKTQLTDKAKINKSDFIVNTSKNTSTSFNNILNIVCLVKEIQ
jgi:dephospho-CoA kinase